MSRKKLVIISCAAAGLVIAASAVLFITLRVQQNPVQAISKQVKNFKVYYFNGNIPGNFALQKETVSYENGILVFSLKSPNNKTVAITEQSIPRAFNTQLLQVQDRFNTLYGEGLLTDANDRTAGALVTDDHTWILINAPSPIGGDTMKALINALQPVN